MSETDASHPALLAVARVISALALIVIVGAVGVLALRQWTVFQSMACPMGSIGSPPPQLSPPGGLSCVADFTQSQTMPTASEQFSAIIGSVTKNAIPIAAFLVAVTVRMGIGRLWPSRRQRASGDPHGESNDGR